MKLLLRRFKNYRCDCGFFRKQVFSSMLQTILQVGRPRMATLFGNRRCSIRLEIAEATVLFGSAVL